MSKNDLTQFKTAPKSILPIGDKNIKPTSTSRVVKKKVVPGKKHRMGFVLPEQEFDKVSLFESELRKQGTTPNLSKLFRAMIHHFNHITPKERINIYRSIPEIKTGRPRKE